MLALGMGSGMIAVFGAAFGVACVEPKGGTGTTDSAGDPDTGPDVVRGDLALSFPLLERERFEIIIGVDHDPVVQENTGLGRLTCLDYEGRTFPHCYDEHKGTDYILKGGFDSMDAGSPVVFASADGVVVRAEDGHYDRCHGSIETGDVSCDGHEIVANAVTIEHETGHFTKYLHLMEGSVAVVEGQDVRRGDPLGRVGSSGRSSMPHLHFAMLTPDLATLDPYAGVLSQEATWWCEQEAGDGLPGPCPD
jgi:murein DD-endopeptidase MepM/ murein hydrolase activator NlpD